MRRPSFPRPDRRRAFRTFANPLTRIALFLVALAAVASFATTAWSAVRFGDPYTLPTGAAPSAVVAADLNGDIRADLVVANAADATVSVYVTDGLGGYAPRVDYAVGLQPRALLLDAVDGDGFVDLVVVNAGSNSISVLHGNGDGTFGARTDYAVGSEPIAVAAVNVTDDGHVDVVVANAGSNDFSLLPGTPAGTLGARTDHPLPGSPRALVAGEWNDLGNGQDLAFSCAPNMVAVFGNDGSGTLSSLPTVTVGNDPVGIAEVDMDDDGRPDLVVANRGDNTLSVLLSASGGVFTAVGTFATGLAPGSLRVEDIDADGYTDFVCSLEGADAVEVLRRREYGVSSRHQVALGAGASSVFAADLDGDYYNDLAALDASQSELQLRINLPLRNGSVAFATPPTPTMVGVVMTPPVEVLVLDENGEPVADEPVWVSMDGSGTLLGASRDVLTDANGIAAFDSLVILGSGPHRMFAYTPIMDAEPSDYFEVAPAAPATIRFAIEPVDVEQGALQPQPIRVQVTDEFDNAIVGATVALSLVGPGTLSGGASRATDLDGYATFDSLRVDSTGLHRLVASSAPTLQVTSAEFAVLGPAKVLDFVVRQAFPAGNGPMGVATGDLDGDGKLDVVSANAQSASISVLRGLGGGHFAAPVSYSTGILPVAVQLHDLDGDGLLDVVVTENAAGMSVRLGQPGGTFGPRTAYTTGLGPWAFAVADLNSDGALDIAVQCGGIAQISMFLGDGHGEFTPAPPLTPGFQSHGIAAGDVDGDGHTDLMVAGARFELALLSGDGLGHFTATQMWSGTEYSGWVALADFNEDGLLDVATNGRFDGGVGVRLGTGGGSMSGMALYPTHGGPYSLAVADVDGDGHLDLATSSDATAKVSVLLGSGRGSFYPAQSFAAAPFPAQVVVADLNADGAGDLVTADNNMNTVSVFMNTRNLPVPTLIELLRATPTAQGVRVEWRYADATALRSCVLERAESEEGEWVAVDRAPITEAGLQVVVDDEAREGRLNWYRLSGTLRSGVAFTYGPVAADALGAVRVLELATPWPNPSRGAATLSYGLPQRAKVRLSLVDLQGREVAVLADGVREAGRHVALLDAADLRPGVYFARLRCGGASLVRRFVLVR